MKLKDVQSLEDNRNIDIDKVGVKDLTYPIILKDRSKGEQGTVANISMSVHLPKEFKGTHMSRFIEILNRHKDNVSIISCSDILDEMHTVLNSDTTHIELSFPYFINKVAPVSKQSALMDYNCDFVAISDKIKGKDFILTVHVPVTSLCPCSKEISEFSAHNQRSIASISIRYHKKIVWIEDLIEVAESSASAPVYSLLKREDEKFVTEQAYNNPVFVEDIVRNITEKLLNDDRVSWFSVECVNMESIHNHSAYANITIDKREKQK